MSYFHNYGEFFAVIFMVIGLFLMIAGGKNYEATTFIAATISVSFLFLVLIFILAMPADSPEWSVWLLMFVCFWIGAGAGAAAKKHIKAGVFFIGMTLGVFGGIVLYNALIYKMCEERPILGLLITVLLTAIAVSSLCMIFFDHVIIVGSSIIGSYFFFRGLSVFAGGYPNEIVLY